MPRVRRLLVPLLAVAGMLFALGCEWNMKKLTAAVVLLSASTGAFAAAPRAAHAPHHGSCPHCHHHG